jgi:hypothetical protein
MTNNKFKFNKWIKGSKEKSYNSDLLVIVSTYFECSCKQAKEYLDVLGKKETKTLLKHIGLQENRIKQLLKK